MSYAYCRCGNHSSCNTKDCGPDLKLNAWYYRNRYYDSDRPEAWKLEGYGKPTAFHLQCEYLEIKVN
jgi:hypothetical protein